MENKLNIEEKITIQSTFMDALEVMKEFKTWTNATISGYQSDIIAFENFLCDNGVDPMLKNAKLHIAQKWVKFQRDEGISSTTIKRRLAALSSMFSFYRDLGIVPQNVFKVVEAPIGASDHHSPILDFEELKRVYEYVDQLRTQNNPISVTVKTMIFTGLRNEALTKLRVKHVNFEKEWIKYDIGVVTSKHKVQIIPLPKFLFEEIKEQIQAHNLGEEEQLLLGLSGQPLVHKALNRITDHVSRNLKYLRDERVTPHGFRATISTLLSERGVDLNAIKFLLGHSEQDNIHHYIRKHSRILNLLRRELNAIEEELRSGLKKEGRAAESEPFAAPTAEPNDKTQHPAINREIVLKLLESDPELAIQLIKKGYAAI